MLELIAQPDVNPLEMPLNAIFASMNENTLRAYRKAFEDFGKFILCDTPAETARTFFSMSEGAANMTMMTYMTELHSRGLATKSIATRMGAIAGIVKRSRIIGIVPWTLSVSVPAGEKYRDTRGPGADAINEMVNKLRFQAKLGDKIAVRNIAIVELLFNPALRRFEVIGLDVGEVDEVNSRVSIRGKGRAEAAWITLPEPTMEAVKAWLDVRGRHAGAVFVAMDSSHAGHRLTGEAIRQIIGKIGDSVGVRARPHSLRHSGITSALQATNNDLVATASFARHRNINTTIIYLDNLADRPGDTARKLAAATRRTA